MLGGGWLQAVAPFIESAWNPQSKIAQTDTGIANCLAPPHELTTQGNPPQTARLRAYIWGSAHGGRA
jgi:hypothetical protein